MREGDFMQQYARAKSTGGKVRRLKIHRTSLRAQNSGEARCMEFRDQYEAYPSKGFLTVTSRGSFTDRVKVFSGSLRGAEDFSDITTRAKHDEGFSDITTQRRFFAESQRELVGSF